jgi:hypothetical protein
MTTSRARLLPLLAVGAVTAGLSIPAIAGAQEYPPPTNTSVPSSSTTVAAATSTLPTSSTTVEAAEESTTLPFTGGDVAGLVTIGIGAIGVGYALKRTARRKARNSNS